MSLVKSIQSELLSGEVKLESVLLKIRFLSAKIESVVLEDWVGFELNGYPTKDDCPEYRMVPVSISGTFSGSFNSSISNAPIAGNIVEAITKSKNWTECSLQDGVAEIEYLFSNNPDGFQLDYSNLIMHITGKIYPNYVCNQVVGYISSSRISGILSAVRARILDLVLDLEKRIPEISNVSIEQPEIQISSSKMEELLMSQTKIIYGDNYEISSSGDSANINIKNVAGDADGLAETLVKVGIAKKDASQLAKIISSEEATSKEEPLGKKAQKWLVKNIGKATNGSWKIGASVATKVISAAALKYYGLDE